MLNEFIGRDNTVQYSLFRTLHLLPNYLSRLIMFFSRFNLCLFTCFFAAIDANLICFHFCLFIVPFVRIASLNVPVQRRVGVCGKIQTHPSRMDSIAKMHPLRPLNRVGNGREVALRWRKKLPRRQSKREHSYRTAKEIDIFHFDRRHSNVPAACCRLWAMHPVALRCDKLLLLGVGGEKSIESA